MIDNCTQRKWLIVMMQMMNHDAGENGSLTKIPNQDAVVGLMRASSIRDQWTQGSARELSFLMVYLPFVTWKVSCASHLSLDLPLDSDMPPSFLDLLLAPGF
nr:uncharacterized protein LOC133574295 isoform X5 [Nerophis lumbriciformis]